MKIERFLWTEHVEGRLPERRLTRSEVEQAIREGHDARQVNTGSADWRVHGIRFDGKGFAVVYDNPADGDSGAVRIVSAWPMRTKKPRS